MATTRIVANRICRMEGGYARPDLPRSDWSVIPPPVGA
jgi:hypothetical protein